MMQDCFWEKWFVSLDRIKVYDACYCLYNIILEVIISKRISGEVGELLPGGKFGFT